MTKITSGTGATFQSNTAEQQLLDCLVLLKLSEQDTTKNTKNLNNTSLTFSINSLTMSGSFTIPVQTIFNPNGDMVIDAVNYLQNVVFTSGNGGTFNASSLQQYLLSVMNYLITTEASPQSNPQQKNYQTSDFQISSGNIVGTCTLPIQYSLVNGNLQISAMEYLL